MTPEGLLWLTQERELLPDCLGQQAARPDTSKGGSARQGKGAPAGEQPDNLSWTYVQETAPALPRPPAGGVQAKSP
jgi:hypothetical protein